MLEWLSDNSSLLAAIANLGMLAVWIFYAQLLYNGYRRERRPRILINKGVAAADLDAPCLICNMSKEPVFVQGIFVDVATSAGTYSAPATDADEGEVDQAERRLGLRTRQGPLRTGDCLEIHRFRELLQKAAGMGGVKLIDGRPQDPEIVLQSLTVTVVSIYGPEDEPFGVSRTFELNCDDPGRVRVIPHALDTTLLNSRREKKRAKEMLRKSFTADSTRTPTP